jgi:hypothetical protein
LKNTGNIGVLQCKAELYTEKPKAHIDNLAESKPLPDGGGL